MGGRAPTVEKARMGQDEGARTKGSDPRSTPVSLPQALQERFRRGLVDISPRWHHHGVGLAQIGEPARHLDCKPCFRTQRSFLASTEDQAVIGDAHIRVIGAEHLTGYGHLEGRYTVENH
jgi:hypothetical protein